MLHNMLRAAAGATDPYAREILADSPISWWRLDEDSGQTLFDRVSGNDASISGAFSLDQPPLINTGSSIGVNDAAVSVNAGQIISDMSADWTVEAWVKYSSFPTGFENGIIFRWDASTELFYLGASEESGWKIGSAGRTPGSGSLVPLSTKQYVVLRHNSGTIELIVNGAFDYSVSSGTWITSVGSFSFATSAGSNPGLDGILDEVAIYDGISLSNARISAHYNAGLA